MRNAERSHLSRLVSDRQADRREPESDALRRFLLGRVGLTSCALAPDEVAPLAASEPASVAAMLRDDLVSAGEADRAERALADRVIDEICNRFGRPLYARVDLVTDPHGMPVLLELEAIEPELYLAASPGASERMAAAVRAS